MPMCMLLDAYELGDGHTKFLLHDASLPTVRIGYLTYSSKLLLSGAASLYYSRQRLGDADTDGDRVPSPHC